MAKIKLVKKDPYNGSDDEQQRKVDSKSLTDKLFFVAINVLAVGVSTYQTFVGYEKDVGGNFIIALTLALISGIFFLALNVEIRNRRRSNRKHFSLLLLYLLPFGISFLGNFNAFYANQTGKDFLKNEVIAYSEQLKTTHNEAILGIVNSENIMEFEQEFDMLKNDLSDEYNAPDIPGWGEECKKKWNRLVQFINEQGVDLSQSAIYLKGLTADQIYRRAMNEADKAKKNIIQSKKNKIDPAIKQIEDKYEPVLAEVENASESSTYTDSMLERLREAENEIRTQAKTLLNKPEEELFSTLPLKPSGESNIGTIKHSFNKAFIEWEDVSATLVSLILSLILDLGALLFVLVMYPYNRQKRAQSAGRINQDPQMI